MKRAKPIGSLVGFLMTTLLLLGLALLLWFDMGLAFSPGQVTAKSREGVSLEGYQSHADFEKQCSTCHQPLSSNLGTKCLACHQDINQQIKNSQGIHSQVTNVSACAACHPDHRGRNFDPTKASFLTFDHSTTGFSLNFHQINYDASPMECAECHQSSTYASVNNQTCMSCHANHDKQFALEHASDFGSNCQGCHDGADRMINFDHSETGFSLEGKHEQAKCITCHSNGALTDTPKDCVQCHKEPEIHRGIFDQACEACHTPRGWLPANLNGQSFTHQDSAGFSLAVHQKDYSGQEINCQTCHPSDLTSFDLQTCTNCHTQQDAAFMYTHKEQFGSDCLSCHDGVDRLSNFDHNSFFPLDGKHAAAQCETCHAGKVYRGTPAECFQCHEEPEIHTGVFGQRCAYCHTTDVWSPATLRQHGFPLNHGLDDPNMLLQCDTCHGANYFDYTCYACHEHQQDEITNSHTGAGIVEADLPVCAKCHPAGVIDKTMQVP